MSSELNLLVLLLCTGHVKCLSKLNANKRSVMFIVFVHSPTSVEGLNCIV